MPEPIPLATLFCTIHVNTMQKVTLPKTKSIHLGDHSEQRSKRPTWVHLIHVIETRSQPASPRPL